MTSRSWYSNWNDPTTVVAWPLALWNDGQFRQGGTSVVVADGFLLTARHCFEAGWNKFHPRTPLPKDDILHRGSIRSFEQLSGLQAGFTLIAYQVLSAGQSSRAWEIDKIWLSPLTDIAL